MAGAAVRMMDTFESEPLMRSLCGSLMTVRVVTGLLLLLLLLHKPVVIDDDGAGAEGPWQRQAAAGPG